ncbi:MAG: UDP-N-acetylmuramate dehydrogenase [Gemmatimonadota bacterium]
MSWERDVALAGLTRYGIGGPTPALGRAGSRAELVELLRSLDGAPYLVLGGGANILVADEGVRERVLLLGGEFDYVRAVEGAIEAGAATRLPAFVGAARREARGGFEFLEAVPGTVGGALRMNAGSRDVWLWHRTRWAEAMTPEGEIVRLDPDQAAPAYRSVGVPESWIFLRGLFDAPPGDPAVIGAAHREFRFAKVANQVYELPSVGSSWKNPGGGHGSAWEVVERLGMRGARRGGAQISERHANFIVNLGDARADDVLALMIETRRRAREELGLTLEPEIRFWGFDEERLRQVGARPEPPC